MGRHGTIAGRKAAQDSKRAQIFTKYARAITVAAKAGGDPEYNITLKNAIEKAKSINMPNDNIKRAIQKGTGELAGESYETGSFEGYGAGGVAVIVDVLTDNKNRTTAAIKHAFDKYNGNLGVPGCVSYMFDRKGIILVEKIDAIEEDALMEAAVTFFKSSSFPRTVTVRAVSVNTVCSSPVRFSVCMFWVGRDICLLPRGRIPTSTIMDSA